MRFQGLWLTKIGSPSNWLWRWKKRLLSRSFERSLVRSFSHLSTQWQRLAAWHYPQKSEHNYWVSSTVPAETLWQTVTNLADLAAWHPLITQTNAPRGQQAKPGLIYRAFNCYVPLSTKIFVERVLPGELLSVRLFPLPGLQERATYRIVSTICGTCVFYSVTLSGWLSPLVWPVVRPQVEQVATALIQAAEQSTQQLPKQSGTSRRRAYSLNNQDIFS